VLISMVWVSQSAHSSDRERSQWDGQVRPLQRLAGYADVGEPIGQLSGTLRSPYF